jgi:hypothetical protein
MRILKLRKSKKRAKEQFLMFLKHYSLHLEIRLETVGNLTGE